MTPDIALVLTILGLASVLFVSGRVRMDLVALLILVSLALTGLLTPAQALSGFSNPAVVTVWAVFILSGGLSRTGVASVMGACVLRVAGKGEVRLLLVLMLAAGAMSAFMNNVGVAALLLPVVMDVSRSTGIPPAKLLIPLAYAALLGGLTTLIGTPPNILVADLLREYGLRPFGVFDYTPVGAAVLLAGILFMATVGRKLLPERDPARERVGEPGVAGRPREGRDLQEAYELRERLFTLRVRPGSPLEGKRLAESRLGAALGLNVLAVLREGRAELAPGRELRLRAGDRLLVQGRPERLSELRERRHLVVEADSLAVERLGSSLVEVAEVRLGPEAPLVGRSLKEVDFRVRYGLNVLAIRRDGVRRREEMQTLTLEAGDRLLVQGARDLLEALREEPGFRVTGAERTELSRLHERLLLLRIPPDSIMVDRSLAESRLGDAFGLTVLAIVRGGIAQPAPDPQEPLQADDLLLVEGEERDLETIRGLQQLEPEREELPVEALESGRVGLVEVVLSPRSALAGKTLRELHFREKYGLTVLAILREGTVRRTDLRDVPLRFGDALLLHGPAERLRFLGEEPDFLVLTRTAAKAIRKEKAPVAAALMAGVLIPVLLGWVPIYIAAVAGAALMVLTGCLTMDEAYREIEWQAVFLIAGTLPLGIALELTGGARFLAGGVLAALGQHGPLAVMAGIFLMTSLATQAIPPPALVVLMAPIVLNAATDLGVSPHALMMVLAMAASASFGSRISHPNLLVMGPGGYRFADYLRVGLPLTLVVFLVVMLVTPLVWRL